MKVEQQLLVNTSQAAAMLGIGRSLLYSMSSDGRLGPQPLAFGKRKLYSVDELREWIKAGCPARDRWRRQWGANSG